MQKVTFHQTKGDLLFSKLHCVDCQMVACLMMKAVLLILFYGIFLSYHLTTGYLFAKEYSFNFLPSRL